MKYLNNLLLGVLTLIGIGLLSIGNKLGGGVIALSIFYGVSLLYKRKLIK